MRLINFLKSNEIIRWFFHPYIIYKRNKLNRQISNRFLKNADRALMKFFEVTENLKLNCWLSFGTLLGAVRENDFLKHDSDIDLGMFFKDYSVEFENALINAGFKKIKQFEVANKLSGFEQSWLYETTKIDIFFHFTDNEKMKCHTFYTIDNKTNILEVTFTNTGFKSTKFKNVIVNVPNNTDLYLKENYGESYMIPNKKWNYIKDPKNIKLIQEFEPSLIEYNK